MVVDGTIAPESFTTIRSVEMRLGYVAHCTERLWTLFGCCSGPSTSKKSSMPTCERALSNGVRWHWFILFFYSVFSFVDKEKQKKQPGPRAEYVVVYYVISR